MVWRKRAGRIASVFFCKSASRTIFAANLFPVGNKNEPFQIVVNNGQYEFNITPSDAAALDVVHEHDGIHHLLANGRAHRAELIEADYINHNYTIRVDGTKYTVHLNDQYERLIQQLGLTIGGSQKQNTVKAPMPGLVLNVMVSPGQTVHKGDTLLILEAMKMENVIKAIGDGVVKSVAVEKGMAVEKGHLLLEME